MPKILTRLRIDEVSAVDRGAGDGVKITLMKRNDDKPAKAKRPAMEKKTTAEKFLNLFRKSTAPSVIEKATDALAKSVNSILDSEEPDKGKALASSFDQFQNYLSSHVTTTDSPVAEQKGNVMSEKLIKALGLKEGATEDDIVKAIAERDLALAIAKAAMDDDEKDYHDNLKSDDEKEKFRSMGAKERKERMKKHDDLPLDVQKRLADAEEMAKRVKVLEDAAALAGFKKRAVALGMPEEFGTTLMKAHAGGADPAALNDILDRLKAANAAARVAGVWDELGVGHGDGGKEQTAYDELRTKAAEYRKMHPELSEHQAFAKVFEDPANRELAKRERAEANSHIRAVR